MIEQPHHLREPGGHQLVGKVRHRQGFLHQRLVHRGGYDQKIGVGFGLHLHVELHAAEDAGGGKQADIPLEQAGQGDFLAALRLGEHPQHPVQHHEQADTVRRAVVQQRAFRRRALHSAARERALLGLRQLIPNGK